MDCLFCEILSGKKNGHLIYEDDLHISILDKYPIDTGHSLIIPREHHEKITDMSPSDVGEMFSIVPKIAKAILDATGADAFNGVAYQIKSSFIHFEGNDGTTIHKHATGVTLGYLFDTLGLDLDDQCFVFKDGKSFCTTEDYSMKFFINGEPVDDIRDHEITEDDKILISYGADEEELESQLLELVAQELLKR